MSSDKYEWDINPDSGDPKNNDFRDDLIMMDDAEMFTKYKFYKFEDKREGKVLGQIVGMVIDEEGDNFEVGFPDGSMRFYSKDPESYAVTNNKERADFIVSAKTHRLEELLNGSD